MTPDAVLQRYRRAFEASDLEGVVACFAAPCAFVSTRPRGGPLVLSATPQQARDGVAQILDWHKRLGVDQLSLVVRHRVELSDQMTCLHLAVTARGLANEALYAFDGVYTLLRETGGWRIGAISHNQYPALLARLPA